LLEILRGQMMACVGVRRPNGRGHRLWPRHRLLPSEWSWGRRPSACRRWAWRGIRTRAYLEGHRGVPPSCCSCVTATATPTSLRFGSALATTWSKAWPPPPPGDWSGWPPRAGPTLIAGGHSCCGVPAIRLVDRQPIAGGAEGGRTPTRDPV